MRNFSWSRINTYASCPLKYKHRYLDHLVPVKKAPALSLGYCMSRGLQSYRQSGSRDDAFSAFMAAWEEDGKVLPMERDEDPRRSVERGLEILGNYTEEHPTEADSVVKPEVSFEVEAAPGINFIGRIDAIIRMADKSLAIIEDKTTSRLGVTYFSRMRGSSQVLWYMWVANKLGLFEIEGKKQMPKCIINAIYIHKETRRFERDIAMKSSKVLELAHQNMLTWINRILAAEEDDCFPLNDVDNSICTAYGGCDYLPLKYLEGSLRDRIVKNEFKIDERKR